MTDHMNNAEADLVRQSSGRFLAALQEHSLQAAVLHEMPRHVAPRLPPAPGDAAAGNRRARKRREIYMGPALNRLLDHRARAEGKSVSLLVNEIVAAALMPKKGVKA